MAEQKKKYQQQFCVHVGTYDGSIMGFTGTLHHLESKYAYSVSAGSVKAITTSGRFLFVAGYDEIIRIYDAKKFKEVGNLDGHLGSILTMKSHKNILFSSGDDGQILTWKFKEWSLITRLKAHTTTIYDIALHPSGKILISISKDNRLFVWNLLNGQKAYQKRFPYSLNKVTFIDEDKYIGVLSDFNVHIINSSDNQEMCLLKSERKINDFISYKRFLIVGDERGYISIWDHNLDQENIEQEEQQEQEKDLQQQIDENSKKAHKIVFKAHTNRVKQMRIQNIDGIDFLISVSSSGELKIWDCLEGILNQVQNIGEDQDLENVIKPVYQIYTNQRITAMDVTVYTNEEQEKKEQQEEQSKAVVQQKEAESEKEEEQQQEEEEEEDPSKPKSILKKSKKIKKQIQQQQQHSEQQKQIQQQKKQKKQQKQQQQQQPQQQQQQNQNKKENKKNKKNKNKSK